MVLPLVGVIQTLISGAFGATGEVPPVLCCVMVSKDGVFCWGICGALQRDPGGEHMGLSGTWL